MASDAEFVAYVVGQIRNVPKLSHRKMFGDYAVYVGDKVVALISDNQFFVKPTAAGRALIGEVVGEPVETPPYDGAKNYFLMDEHLDDADFISQLIRVTEKDVPPPKPKKRKS